MQADRKLTPPTHEEIIELVGDLDDAIVASILATSASFAEIEAAARRAAGEADKAADAHPVSPRAEAVFIGEVQAANGAISRCSARSCVAPRRLIRGDQLQDAATACSAPARPARPPIRRGHRSMIRDAARSSRAHSRSAAV
jgi:hypothetical protein